ncbi:MAG TPA: SDR family oxidoreductase [Polyangiaceae bacterium]|nr:SDR family oxidoreductase [Polyangiaceae bacterium]
MKRFAPTDWALILGGSSGFGLASAKKLASEGMSVAVAHRDRKSAMAGIDREFASIRAGGAELLAFNVDALSPEGRAAILAALAERLGAQGRVRVLLHSIARGNLKLIASPRPGPTGAALARARLAELLGVAEDKLASAIEAAAGDHDALAEIALPPAFDAERLLDEDDFAQTIHAMGTSIVGWAMDLLGRRLFADDARVLGLTSEGNQVAWRGYAAVAAAKVTLESVVRAMAVELAPYGVRSNVLQAGISDTPALRLIPGSARIKADARRRNPFGRLTTPEDVADVVFLMCTSEARWINGAIVRVDGGEHVGG